MSNDSRDSLRRFRVDPVSGSVVLAQQSPPEQPCLSSSDRSTVAPVADSPSAWITNLAGLQQVRIQTAPRAIRLLLKDVVVDAVDENGFWLGAKDTDCRLYVVPAEGALIRVRRGEVVSVQGEIRFGALQEASGARPRRQPYLYSYIVRPAWYPDAKPEATARR